MSHTLFAVGDVFHTIDGPFTYRTWVVRPNGAIDEVRPWVKRPVPDSVSDKKCGECGDHH